MGDKITSREKDHLPKNRATTIFIFTPLRLQSFKEKMIKYSLNNRWPGQVCSQTSTAYCVLFVLILYSINKFDG